MDIKSLRREINGLEIAYTDTGAKDGRILFCVHGLLSNGRDYDALALYMAAKGRRVVAIDLPGRGQSSCFSDESLYTLPNYLPYCIDLAMHVSGGKGFDFLGVSLGGMIAMSLHGFEDLNIERLIIVDIGAQIPASALDSISSMVRSADSSYKTKDEAVSFLKRRCSSWGIGSDAKGKAIWEHLINHNIKKLGSGEWAMHYDPKIAGALPEKNEDIEFWDLWEQIKQPLLLVRGGKSLILPENIARDMQKRYSGARMETIVFPECGHVPNLMEEGQISRLGAWLDG